MTAKTVDYVITLHQDHLPRTTKHWDSFVSHCRSIVTPLPSTSMSLGVLLPLLSSTPLAPPSWVFLALDNPSSPSVTAMIASDSFSADRPSGSCGTNLHFG